MRNRLIAAILCNVSFLPVFAASRPIGTWVGTWAAAPMSCPAKSGAPSAGDSTYRNVVRIGIGGKGFRVQLTNEFGATQLMVGSARIGIDAGDGSIKPGSDRELTFGGQPSVTIPVGGLMLSDEIPMEVPALSSLAVSVYVTDQVIATRTCHLLASSTNYITKGDATKAGNMKNARTTDSWNFVKGIDVRTDKNAFAIVALGDSITDGAASTKDANHRWTDELAERLQKSSSAKQVAVLNEGIVGNRVLRTEWGQSAIARFDRDVLAQNGARYLILFEGINDINWQDPSEDASADELIVGISQLVERAHAHGITVIAATLTPFAGADGYSEKAELVRVTLNNWYRTAGVVDGIVDFEKAVRDPSKPTALNPTYDSGDHLHPNDAGYKALANTIDLSLFQ